MYTRVSRAKKANIYTDEHVCAFTEKTIGDSEESADRLGAPRSLILSRARFLSVSLSLSLSLGHLRDIPVLVRPTVSAGSRECFSS